MSSPGSRGGITHPAPEEGRIRVGGSALLALLLVLTVGIFVATRVARSSEDIVNSVELTERIEVGQSARISFQLTEPDGSADLLILAPEGVPVRALAEAEPLAAGGQSFRWDGRDGDGDPVAPGEYRIHVALGELDRSIEPPGTITVLPTSTPSPRPAGAG